MAEEIDIVAVLERLETLQKEHEALKTEKTQLETSLKAVEEKQKEDERKALVEKLIEKKGKTAKELEGKSMEVLKELLEVLPAKKVEEKDMSKGLVENVTTPDVKEKEIFEVDKSGDLSMTEEAWKEFDNKIKEMSNTNGYKWMPNKVGKNEVS